MPAVRKIDLMPPELRRWLKEELERSGFGDHREITEALNFRLQEEGLELSIGKSAIGDYSKALKDQREAFAIADALLSDMDIEAEGDLHRTLMQMIATSAVQMIQHVRNDDKHLDAKELMSLGRMLKDLMASSGMREKLLDDLESMSHGSVALVEEGVTVHSAPTNEAGEPMWVAGEIELI